MAKGRKPIAIDKQQIQAIIYKVESENTFTKREELWGAVAPEIAKALNRESVSTTFVYQKFIALDLECKTPKGKRGGEGSDFGRSQGIKPRSGKRRGISAKASAAIFAELPRWANELRVINLLAKAEGGSMKAMVALKCLDCSCYQPLEIRKCQSETCSLYSIRPFQGKKAVEGEELELVPAGVEE